MATSVTQTHLHHEVSETIAELKQDLRDARAERRLIMKSPEQYSLDTGNTRQFVIKQRLPALTSLIESLTREIAESEAQLADLNGEGGSVTILYPLMR